MIDRNKLNRVKGILSAKRGAEIPKFNGGAKFAMYGNNQTIYSADRSKWFLDAALTQAYGGSLAGFKSIQVPTQTASASSVGTTTAVTTPVTTTPAVVTQTTTSAPTPTGVTSDGVNIELPEITAPTLPTEVGAINTNNTINTQFEESAGMNMTNLQKNQQVGSIVGNVGNMGSAVLSAVGDGLGAKQMMTDSNITKGADTTYSAIANGVANLGPYGKMVSTAMNAAKAVGNVVQELGGGTDQQTTTDKWMDSAFFSWNIGMLNGFAGKNSDSFGIDQNTLAQVGSSYGGTVSDLNDAAAKADKKYGLFSSKARKKANEAIAAAASRQSLMGNIADSAEDQRLAVQSMGEQAGLAYSMMTGGGYDQKYTYAAKHGGLLEWNPVISLEWEPQVELNWDLPKFKEGGNVELIEELEWIPEFKSGNKIDFNTWFNSIPEQFRANGYDYKKAYEVFDWEDLRKHAEDPNKNHLKSVSPVSDGNGNYPFLKLGKLEENPELQGEFDWYNSDDGKEHRAKFDIQYIGDRYYYVPKKFKDGGKTKESDVPEIEETTQKNVIPEGALHKNKHHMEHAEGLTKKGIPVIDGDGEQQAEIEHSEIIFTLEVTKKLEEYYEIFYSDESSTKEKEQAALNAGKLLVFQILENTEDRTGLIDSCKKGGSLTLKKSTDDLINEVLEWSPELTIIIEDVKEESHKNKSKECEIKSEKEMMKDAIKEVLIELLTK